MTTGHIRTFVPGTQANRWQSKGADDLLIEFDRQDLELHI